MASSGWQNEQTWFTYSSNIRLIGNIYISSITHTGTNLRIKGTIAAGARGSSNYKFYYSDYTSYAQPEGGNKIALGAKGRTWKVGDSDVHVDFDVTLSNVAASATSRSFYVNFYGPNTSSVKATLRWTLSFSASGSAPSGGYITYNSCTWDSINATSGVSSWGGINGTLCLFVATGTTNGDIDDATTLGSYARREYWYGKTSELSHTFNADDASTSGTWYGTPLSVKGLLHYKLGYYNYNSIGNTSGIDSTLRYLPPAPGQLAYSDPGGAGTKVVPVEYTGVVANNNANYDQSELTRSVRYKIDDGQWVWVTQAVTALDAVTSFDVSVPVGSYATVEAWMNYHGMSSEVSTVTIPNNNNPFGIYGSVNDESVATIKWYGPVNNESKKIIKIYGPHGGVARKLFEDV